MPFGFSHTHEFCGPVNETWIHEGPITGVDLFGDRDRKLIMENQPSAFRKFLAFFILPHSVIVYLEFNRA